MQMMGQARSPGKHAEKYEKARGVGLLESGEARAPRAGAGRGGSPARPRGRV